MEKTRSAWWNDSRSEKWCGKTIRKVNGKVGEIFSRKIFQNFTYVLSESFIALLVHRTELLLFHSVQNLMFINFLPNFKIRISLSFEKNWKNRKLMDFPLPLVETQPRGVVFVLIVSIMASIWTYYFRDKSFDKYTFLFWSIYFSELSEIFEITFLHKSVCIKIQRLSGRYLKKLELLNWLRLFMDQFVCYIHGKVCSLSNV